MLYIYRELKCNRLMQSKKNHHNVLNKTLDTIIDTNKEKPIQKNHYIKDQILNTSEDINQKITTKQTAQKKNNIKTSIEFLTPMYFFKELMQNDITFIIDLFIIQFIYTSFATYSILLIIIKFIIILICLINISSTLSFMFTSLFKSSSIALGVMSIIFIFMFALYGYNNHIINDYINQNSNSSQEKIDKKRMLLKKIIQYNIAQKIDLRAYAGDDSILDKYKPIIEIICDKLFNQLLSFLLSNLPAVSYLLLNLIVNTISTIQGFLDKEESLPIYILGIIYIIHKLQKSLHIDDTEESITTILQSMFHSIYIMNKVIYFLLLLYIFILILRLYYMPTNTIQPLEYVCSLINNRENLITCGIYDAQKKVARNLIIDTLFEQSKWNVYITIVIISILIIIMIQIYFLTKNIFIMVEFILSPFVLHFLEFISWVYIINFIYDIIKYSIGFFVLCQLLYVFYNTIKKFDEINNVENVVMSLLENFVKLNVLQMDTNIYQLLSLMVNTIILNNVSMGYSDGHYVLDNVSLTIFNGKIIFVVGRSGEGKTTCMNAIQGKIFLDGSILLSDGINMQNIIEVLPADRRLIIASVPQIPVFNSQNLTVREYFDKTSYTNEKEKIQVLLDLKLAETTDEAIVFLNRNLGLNASVLSGGQKSRVLIALAIFQHAFITTIDESFDNLDAHTIGELLQVLCNDEYISKHALITITHRLLEIVNQLYNIYGINKLRSVYIWHVDNGKLVEYNLYELLQKGKLQVLLLTVSGVQKFSQSEYKILEHDMINSNQLKNIMHIYNNDNNINIMEYKDSNDLAAARGV